MRPKHISKGIHQRLQLFQPQLLLSTPTGLQISFELVQARMYLLVLCQKFQLFPKLGHLSGEDGEYVVFLNGMVRSQVMAEVKAHGEELTEGDVRRASPAGAGGVERFPCLAETVMLPICQYCTLRWGASYRVIPTNNSM